MWYSCWIHVISMWFPCDFHHLISQIHVTCVEQIMVILFIFIWWIVYSMWNTALCCIWYAVYRMQTSAWCAIYILDWDHDHWGLNTYSITWVQLIITNSPLFKLMNPCIQYRLHIQKSQSLSLWSLLATVCWCLSLQLGLLAIYVSHMWTLWNNCSMECMSSV